MQNWQASGVEFLRTQEIRNAGNNTALEKYHVKTVLIYGAKAPACDT